MALNQCTASGVVELPLYSTRVINYFAIVSGKCDPLRSLPHVISSKYFRHLQLLGHIRNVVLRLKRAIADVLDRLGATLLAQWSVLKAR